MGKIILDLNKIQKYYNKKLFFPDLLVLFSILFNVFELKFTTNSIHYSLISFFFVFTYPKFCERLHSLQEFIIQEKEKLENYFSISLLYLKTFFIAHLMGCLWYIVGSLYYENETWISKANIRDDDWISKYITSLYWSLVTMLSVGYGDIVPTNNSEKLVCILTMFVGFSVFGYTLGSMSDIIQKMNAKDQELK